MFTTQRRSADYQMRQRKAKGTESNDMEYFVLINQIQISD